MTEQEIFDAAVNGLAKQGFERSVGTHNNGACAYRGEFGMKCAIGHVLSDEDLQTKNGSYEGTLRELPERAKHRLGIEVLDTEVLDTPRFNFLCQLQMAHDGAVDTPTYMKKELQWFAAKHNLTIPEALK